MSNTKHTPGPWHRNIEPARKYPTVWSGRNKHVAYVAAGAPRGSGNGQTMLDDEIEANINLIAAAPELLEAASKLVAAFAKHKTWATAGVMRGLLPYSEADLRAESDKAMAALRAAVTKAEMLIAD